MHTTRTYCSGQGDFCDHCGAPLAAQGQICRGPQDDPNEAVELALTRREWGELARAADRRQRYLTRRAARPSSLPTGPDAIALQSINRVVAAIEAILGLGDFSDPDSLASAILPRRDWAELVRAVQNRADQYAKRMADLDEAVGRVAGRVRALT